MTIQRHNPAYRLTRKYNSYGSSTTKETDYVKSRCSDWMFLW